MTDVAFQSPVRVVRTANHWVEYNRGRGKKPWGVYRQVGDTRAWIADFVSKEAAEAWIKSRQQ